MVGKLEVGGVLQDRVRGFVQMQCLHMGVFDACLNWLQALSANGLDTSRVPGLSYPTQSEGKKIFDPTVVWCLPCECGGDDCKHMVLMLPGWKGQ